MQRPEIAEVINSHFDAIRKHTHKIPVHLSREIVHDIRVEIKKLRAFLKLLRAEPGSSDLLKIRRRLKAFYGYLGIIRDIELQEQLITELVNEDLAAIDTYMHQLHSESQGWKKDVS
jgi:CHAD domain-containing protein